MAKYRFEQIAINCTQKRIPTEDDNAGYIGLEHLDSGSLTVTRWGSQVPLKGEKLVMHKGDVLLGKRNAYLRRAAVCPHDGVFSAHGMVLQPKEEVIDKSFFPLFIASNYFFDEAIRISVGSLSPTVNWKDLKNVVFDLPSIDEQKKLASVLWAINDTIESYKRLISATDDLVKSQFMEQFASLIKDDTKCSTIENICTLFADGDWIESKDQSDAGIRLIQTGNVGNGEFLDKGERARFIDEATFERLHCTEILPKDILISRLPDPVGRACVIPEGLGKSITAVDCTIVRLKQSVLPEFFVAYTLTPLYASQIATFITGSTRQRVSRKNLGQVVLPLPSLELQSQFAEFVRQSDKSKFELEQALSELTATYKRIISDNLC